MTMTHETAIPGKEACPGYLVWSAFGAIYPDTVCSTSLVWEASDGPGDGVLCDADDDLSPKDVPCPFCNPEGFVEYLWGGGTRRLLWAADETPVAEGTEIHFHETDDAALWWSATHPERGEERVLAREIDDEEN